MERVTVCTPTYNRANTLSRVYDSLCKQTFKDFVWIVIDDGSTDDTKRVIEEYKKKSLFPIVYFFQSNMGKHIAVNEAVRLCHTELFIIADSDDGFVPQSLEILVKTWDDIKEKDKFKAVACRCADAQTKCPIGPDFPFPILDDTDDHAYFKLRMRSEKWMMFKTSVFREFPFPEIKNAHFYPETALWQTMGKKYQNRYINVCLRQYYKNSGNSLVNTKKTINFHENIYLWEHFINNEFHYFWSFPKRFIQSFVGINRDGILNGLKYSEIRRLINSPFKRVISAFFFPIGFILASNYKRK